jgi:hypothetical protein
MRQRGVKGLLLEGGGVLKSTKIENEMIIIIIIIIMFSVSNHKFENDN